MSEPKPKKLKIPFTVLEAQHLIHKARKRFHPQSSAQDQLKALIELYTQYLEQRVALEILNDLAPLTNQDVENLIQEVQEQLGEHSEPPPKKKSKKTSDPIFH